MLPKYVLRTITWYDLVRSTSVARAEKKWTMDNPFDCLSDDYQTRVEEKAAAEAIMATKVRLQVQF